MSELLICLKFIMNTDYTDLSSSVAEGLGHGDVTHTLRAGGLTVVHCLMSLGSPGKEEKNGRDETDN